MIGTLGLFVWAGFLPESDEATPLGWSLLLGALPIAAVGVLVMRLLGRSRPLFPSLQRLRGDPAQLSPTTRAVLDGIEMTLTVILVAALALFAVAIVAVVVASIGWHATLPVAVGVVPFAVFLGASLGLWLMGRGEFPGGG